jgi:D-arginine dehydrogenase
VGQAPDAPGFVWVVGLGGFGIMTAPALGRLAAAAAVGEPLAEDMAALGIDPAAYSPARFCAA